MFRTVKFWVLYDPAKRRFIQIERFKYLLPVPSRETGLVIFQCKGHYPRQVGKP